MTVQQPASELELEKGENESEIDILDMMEKDSDEEELDRLVLGDGAAFKSQLGRTVVLDRAESSEGYDAEGGDPEEEEGLADVDDADVRDFTTLSW